MKGEPNVLSFRMLHLACASAMALASQALAAPVEQGLQGGPYNAGTGSLNVGEGGYESQSDDETDVPLQDLPKHPAAPIAEQEGYELAPDGQSYQPKSEPDSDNPGQAKNQSVGTEASPGPETGGPNQQ